VQPNIRFKKLDKRFWANVRTISESLGYTDRKAKQVRVYTLDEMIAAMNKIGLGSNHLVNHDASPTELAILLHEYFAYRADILNLYVEPRLMTAERAGDVFNQMRAQVSSTRPTPMNKQKGKRKSLPFLLES
jgi:hypothetical protein